MDTPAPRLNTPALGKPGTPGSLHDPIVRYSQLSGRTLKMIAAILAVAALAVGGLSWIRQDSPSSITQTHLAGPRSPHPVNITLLLDRSGSFEPYESIRTAALQQISNWSGNNLRPTDTITIIVFAGNAKVMLPPTEIRKLSGPMPAEPATSDGTLIGPALTEAGKLARPGYQQHLIIVTDTQAADLDTTTIEPAYSATDAVDMTLLYPDTIDHSWAIVFPWEHTTQVAVDDPDSTALAIGKAIATATGQTLETT